MGNWSVLLPTWSWVVLTPPKVPVPLLQSSGQNMSKYIQTCFCYHNVFTFTVICANMYWFNYQYICLICINSQQLLGKFKTSNIFVCHLVLTFKLWQNVLFNLSWTGSNSFFELDHLVKSVSRKKMYQLLHKNGSKHVYSSDCSVEFSQD